MRGQRSTWVRAQLRAKVARGPPCVTFANQRGGPVPADLGRARASAPRAAMMLVKGDRPPARFVLRLSAQRLAEREPYFHRPKGAILVFGGGWNCPGRMLDAGSNFVIDAKDEKQQRSQGEG
jgi:hypothetical protein